MQKNLTTKAYMFCLVIVILITTTWLVLGDNLEPVMVKDITPNGSSDFTGIGNMINADGKLFFTLYNSDIGHSLWKSDGTEAGTTLVKQDMFPSLNSDNPRFNPTAIAIDNTLFFYNSNINTGDVELWKSNGTSTGTVLLKSFSTAGDMYDLTNVNGTLFFFVSIEFVGNDQLWKSDGTTAGTVLVKNIDHCHPYCSQSAISYQGSLFFIATDDGTADDQLWKSDGTEAGTVIVKDISARGHLSGLDNLTIMNNTLFFSANDGTYGGELWRSDGTEAGTVMVRDIWPGELHSSPSNLTVVDDTLFFIASDGGSQCCELWKSDGTAVGTIKVKDVKPEAGSLLNVNGTLFFTIQGDFYHRELWKSNSTGTMMIKDFAGWGGYAGVTDLTNVNGTLFFTEHGRYELGLWKSDLTSSANITVTQIFTGAGIQDLISVNSNLFFTFDDGTHGQELWTLFVNGSTPPQPTPSPPVLNINSVGLEHKSVSSGRWISTTTTYDGNIVRITANIENSGGSDGSAQVKFINDDTGETIGTVTQNSFPVGQVTPVSLEWDTSGLAWKADGSAQISPIPIKIVVSDVEETASLIVYPKPVILVHGINSDAKTWGNYYDFIVPSHIAWQVYAVGDGQASGTMNTGTFATRFNRTNTIAENAFELFTYIEEIRERQNVWQIDLVTHSMGGLISRYYIQHHMPVEDRPAVSRLLMMGTPNGGSRCAELFAANQEEILFPAMSQLRTDYLEIFNQEISERRGVKFSILAGDQYVVPCQRAPFPVGDLLVTVDSALAIPISDNTARTDSWHGEMTSSFEDFDSFVKPRLSNVISINSTENGNSIESKKIQASTDFTPQLTFGEVIDISSSDTQTVSLPQIGGSDLHILLANMSTIDASLRNPSSVVVDTIIANSDEAKQMFITMSSGSQVSTGTYELELTNIGTKTVSIPVNAWAENDPVELEFIVKNLDQPEQLTLSQEQIQILATFTNNGIPILDGDVVVKIIDEDGTSNMINLFDDGDHQDGQANDGIYGNVETSLTPDIYLFKVKAEADEILRLTSSLRKVDSYKKMFLPIIVK